MVILITVDLQKSHMQYADIFTVYFLVSFLMPISSSMYIFVPINAKPKAVSSQGHQVVILHSEKYNRSKSSKIFLVQLTVYLLRN